MSTGNFIESVWNGWLRPYQREVLSSWFDGKLHYCQGSRQIGKTDTGSIFALLCCLGVDIEINGKRVVVPPHDVHIVSKNQQKAIEFVRRCKRWAQKANLAAPVLDDKLGSTQRIAFTTGAYLRAYSGVPDSLQGETGTVIFDEFAASDHDASLAIEQTSAVTSSRGHFRLIINSNAGVKGSSSWEHWQRAAGGGWDSYHDITIEDAWPDLPEDHRASLERIKELLGGEESPGWQRWYLNKWVEGEGRWFDDALISSVQRAGSFDARSRIVSFDPAYARDGFGAVAVDVTHDGQVHVVEAVRWYGEAGALDALADAFISKHEPVRIHVDPGAVGYRLAKELERLHGARVSLGSTTRKSRDEAAETAIQLARSGRLSVSPGCGDLLEDLREIQIAGDGVDLPRYKDKHGRQSHCDCADALFAALDDPLVSIRSRRPATLTRGFRSSSTAFSKSLRL